MEKLGLLPAQSISFLAQGEYNKNFLITDQSGYSVVFRINYGSQINVAKQSRYEYQALQILYKSKHTPKPLFLDDTRNFFKHDILIEEFLPGKPLIYHRDLKMSAKILASVHNLNLDSKAYQNLKVETNICTDRLEEANQLLEPVVSSTKLKKEQINVLISLKNWCEENNADKYFSGQPLCLVNTEVNSNNFLITDNYGYLIDWEKPVISNAVQDLTQFMVETTTLWRTTEVLNSKQVEVFLTEYSKRTNQSSDLLMENINKYMPFMLLRALSWCAMLVATYDDKPIKNVEILHRCQSFLKLDFMVPLLNKYGVTF
ncbi:phosphotransferase [Companilactobacillus allii]|uniref:Phosphotransferase n=2 Tax=Companilactobacillus allii TaxID=1847728 RepID=A0A1P8Q687_9LACO|nr:phosphotransferase [Companilactobacillus allii]